MRANLTTLAGKTGVILAAAGIALIAAGAIVVDGGSGRVARPVIAVALLIMGGALTLAIPLRLANSVMQLPAVRARVTDVTFEADSQDTLEATVHGMARGNAALEPHPDCTYRPEAEERGFEIDEAWAAEIAPGSTLVALLHPRRRLIHALGIDGDAGSVEG